MKINVNDIQYLRTYLNNIIGGNMIHPQTAGDWDNLFRAISSAFTQITDNYDELEKEIESLKKERSKKEMEGSFAKTVLNRITILKNIINDRNKDAESEFISMAMIQVETIEKEVIDTNTVTKQQLEKLNEIHKEYTK